MELKTWVCFGAKSLLYSVLMFKHSFTHPFHWDHFTYIQPPAIPSISRSTVCLLEHTVTCKIYSPPAPQQLSPLNWKPGSLSTFLNYHHRHPNYLSHFVRSTFFYFLLSVPSSTSPSMLVWSRSLFIQIVYLSLWKLPCFQVLIWSRECAGDCLVSLEHSKLQHLGFLHPCANKPLQSRLWQ